MRKEGRLALDHFYLGFSEAEILEIKRLLTSLSGVHFAKVKSGKDRWQGIYLYSNIRSYFEIIQGADKYGFGIAVSASTPHYVDGRKSLPKKFRWEKGRRFWGNTKKVWFDWFSLYDTPKKKGQTLVSTWLMYYHLLNREDQRTNVWQSNIDRFKELEFSVGKNHVRLFKRHFQWLPGDLKSSRNLLILNLRDRDGGALIIRMHLLPGNERPKFRKLTMQAHPERKTPTRKTKSFRIRQRGTKVTFERI